MDGQTDRQTDRQADMCVTCDRLADTVQVCDVRVGGVDLKEILLDLQIAVVTKLQR